MKTPSEPYEATPYEVQIYIVRANDDHYHIMLKHPNGDAEISHQSWSTYKEACAAADQFARDIGVEKIHRVH